MLHKAVKRLLIAVHEKEPHLYRLWLAVISHHSTNNFGFALADFLQIEDGPDIFHCFFEREALGGLGNLDREHSLRIEANDRVLDHIGPSQIAPLSIARAHL